jgi:hypothetical protein
MELKLEVRMELSRGVISQVEENLRAKQRIVLCETLKGKAEQDAGDGQPIYPDRLSCSLRTWEDLLIPFIVSEVSDTKAAESLINEKAFMGCRVDIQDQVEYGIIVGVCPSGIEYIGDLLEE